MRYLVVIFGLFLSCSMGIEFDRPCRDTVPAKENFSPAFVSWMNFAEFNLLELKCF